MKKFKGKRVLAWVLAWVMLTSSMNVVLTSFANEEDSWVIKSNIESMYIVDEMGEVVRSVSIEELHALSEQPLEDEVVLPPIPTDELNTLPEEESKPNIGEDVGTGEDGLGGSETENPSSDPSAEENGTVEVTIPEEEEESMESSPMSEETGPFVTDDTSESTENEEEEEEEEEEDNISDISANYNNPLAIYTASANTSGAALEMGQSYVVQYNTTVHKNSMFAPAIENVRASFLYTEGMTHIIDVSPEIYSSRTGDGRWDFLISEGALTGDVSWNYSVLTTENPLFLLDSMSLLFERVGIQSLSSLDGSTALNVSWKNRSAGLSVVVPDSSVNQFSEVIVANVSTFGSMTGAFEIGELKIKFYLPSGKQTEITPVAPTGGNWNLNLTRKNDAGGYYYEATNLIPIPAGGTGNVEFGISGTLRDKTMDANGKVVYSGFKVQVVGTTSGGDTVDKTSGEMSISLGTILDTGSVTKSNYGMYSIPEGVTDQMINDNYWASWRIVIGNMEQKTRGFTEYSIVDTLTTPGTVRRIFKGTTTIWENGSLVGTHAESVTVSGNTITITEVAPGAAYTIEVSYPKATNSSSASCTNNVSFFGVPKGSSSPIVIANATETKIFSDLIWNYNGDVYATYKGWAHGKGTGYSYQDTQSLHMFGTSGPVLLQTTAHLMKMKATSAVDLVFYDDRQAYVGTSGTFTWTSPNDMTAQGVYAVTWPGNATRMDVYVKSGGSWQFAGSKTSSNNNQIIDTSSFESGQVCIIFRGITSTTETPTYPAAVIIWKGSPSLVNKLSSAGVGVYHNLCGLDVWTAGTLTPNDKPASLLSINGYRYGQTGASPTGGTMVVPWEYSELMNHDTSNYGHLLYRYSSKLNVTDSQINARLVKTYDSFVANSARHSYTFKYKFTLQNMTTNSGMINNFDLVDILPEDMYLDTSFALSGNIIGGTYVITTGVHSSGRQVVKMSVTLNNPLRPGSDFNVVLPFETINVAKYRPGQQVSNTGYAILTEYVGLNQSNIGGYGTDAGLDNGSIAGTSSDLNSNSVQNEVVVYGKESHVLPNFPEGSVQTIEKYIESGAAKVRSLDVNAGEQFTYDLVVTAFDEPMRNVVVYDLLPFVGDKKYDGSSRDSTASVSFVDIDLSQAGYTPVVYYSTEQDNISQSSAWLTTLPAGGASSVKSLKLDFGSQEIPANTQITIRIICKASSNPSEFNKIAKNSFFYTKDVKIGGVWPEIPDLTLNECSPVDLKVLAIACSQLGDTLFADSNANGIMDVDEEGVAGIANLYKGGKSASDKVDSAAIGANGKYSFSVTSAGTYYVEIVPDVEELRWSIDMRGELLDHQNMNRVGSDGFTDAIVISASDLLSNTPYLNADAGILVGMVGPSIDKTGTLIPESLRIDYEVLGVKNPNDFEIDELIMYDFPEVGNITGVFIPLYKSGSDYVQVPYSLYYSTDKKAKDDVSKSWVEFASGETSTVRDGTGFQYVYSAAHQVPENPNGLEIKYCDIKLVFTEVPVKFTPTSPLLITSVISPETALHTEREGIIDIHNDAWVVLIKDGEEVEITDDDDIEIPVIENEVPSISKSTANLLVKVGDTISYDITNVKNPEDVFVTDFVFTDIIPQGLTITQLNMPKFAPANINFMNNKSDADIISGNGGLASSVSKHAIKYKITLYYSDNTQETLSTVYDADSVNSINLSAVTKRVVKVEVEFFASHKTHPHEFNVVPAGFSQQAPIVIVGTVNSSASNLSKLTNVANIKYNAWGEAKYVEDDADSHLLDLNISKTVRERTPEAYDRSADGKAQVFPGESVVFDIIVTNNTEIQLENLLVKDSMGVHYYPGLELINPTWTFDSASKTFSKIIPSIGASSQVSLEFNYVVPESLAAVRITNLAQVFIDFDEDGDFEDEVPWDEDDDSVDVLGSPDFSIEKKLANGQPYIVMPGETVDYVITVTNTGDVPLVDLVVTDNLVPGWSRTVTLPVGQLVNLDVSYVVPSTIKGGTKIRNVATGTYIDPKNPDEPIIKEGEKSVVTKIVKDISVLKTLDNPEQAYINAGEVVRWKLSVTNLSNIDLIDIKMTDDLLPGWSHTIPLLRIGETFTTTVDWPSPGNLKPLEVVKNTETAVVPGVKNPGNDGIPDPDSPEYEIWNPSDVPSNVQDIVKKDDENTQVKVNRSVSITKDVAGGATSFKPGEYITYDIVVKNTGNFVLYDLVVTDDKDPSWVQNIPTLQVGESRAFIFTYKVPANTSADELIDNWAFVVVPPDTKSDLKGADRDKIGNISETLNDKDNAQVVAGESSNYYVEKELAPGQKPEVKPGDTVKYVIIAYNKGNKELKNVKITDSLDSSWVQICNIPAGSRVEFEFSYKVPSTHKGGTLNNIATMTPEGKPSVEDDVDVEVIPPFYSLSIDKLLAPGQASTVFVGDTVKFIIQVSNTGKDPLTNIVVTDSLLPSWRQTISYLDPGESKGFNIEIMASESTIKDGKMVNVAKATSDETDPVEDTETVLIKRNSPDIRIVKELAAGQQSIVEAGSTVHYDLIVTNIGDCVLENVTVTDSLDSSFIRNIGTLGVGETKTVEFSYTVPESSQPGSVLTNIAYATGKDPHSGRTVEDDGSVDIRISDPELLVPFIRIDKRLAEGQEMYISYGSTVHYTLTVTNDGEVDLFDVEVTDSLDPNWVRNISSLRVGESETFDFYYEVPAHGIHNGDTILNIGFASGRTSDGTVVEDNDSVEVVTDDELFDIFFEEPPLGGLDIPTEVNLPKTFSVKGTLPFSMALSFLLVGAAYLLLSKKKKFSVFA